MVVNGAEAVSARWDARPTLTPTAGLIVPITLTPATPALPSKAVLGAR